MNTYQSRRKCGATLPYLLLIAALAGLLSACAGQSPAQAPTPALTQAETTPQPMQPTAAPAAPTAAAQPTAGAAPSVGTGQDVLAESTLARGYLTTPNELRRIGALARRGQQPYAIATQQLLNYADEALDDWDENVPATLKFSDDVEKPKYLSVGAKYVYAWALAYNLQKDADPQGAEVYAERAHELVMGMPKEGTEVRNYDNNARLNLGVYIENFVYAADLLADWTPPGQDEPFARSADAEHFKAWLGRAIVRYPYNAAYTRVNNWSTWGRLTTAVIADYVGDDAPLYVQRMSKDAAGAYQVDPETPCEPGEIESCVAVDAHTMYADALRLHFDMVDGKLYEFTPLSCDGLGIKSMIRPDGGMPDELRRQYDCEATRIDDSYGAAARYSQFALESMVSLAELAWRRGDVSLYTHIDEETGRGALYRAAQFLLDNDVTLTRGSMLEMVNRFYTYQLGVESDPAKRAEFERLLSYDLPGILKSEDDWPEGAGFVSFGTLTHGFGAGEAPSSPPMVAAR
jgi:hypothetical protein